MSNLKTKGMSAFIGVIVILILFSAYAVIIPEAVTGSNALLDNTTCVTASGTWNVSDSTCRTNANGTGAAVAFNSIPLNGLFTNTGVIYVIVMVGLLIIIIGGIMVKGKR